MTFASIKGGAAPVDLGSVDATKEDAVCVAFYAEGSETRGLVDATVKLSTVTDLSSFDAVFFVGGFGTMWDFPDDSDVQRVAKEMFEAGKVVSAVCHGPCALVNVKLSDGSYLVAGKSVAAFSNAEEDAVQRRGKVCEHSARHFLGVTSQPPSPCIRIVELSTLDLFRFISLLSARMLCRCPSRAKTSVLSAALCTRRAPPGRRPWP
jgi:putative intracellular protease/amidase